MGKGITQALRDLGIGEQITATNIERSDIHRIASRVGIQVKCEKFIGGFYVTRVSTSTTSPRERTENAMLEQHKRQVAQQQQPPPSTGNALADFIANAQAKRGIVTETEGVEPDETEPVDEWAGWSDELQHVDQDRGDTVTYREHLKTGKRQEIRRETYYG